MNHVRELTSRIRAFTRHNLSSFTGGGGTNNTHTTNDEETEQGEERERTFSGRYDYGIPRIVYNAMEQALGSTLFPIVFYILIMLGLFFSAVLLTAITGDGRRIPNGNIPNTNTASVITGGTNNPNDPTSTSIPNAGNGNVIASFPVDGAVAVHPIEGNRFAAISIFLAMTVFSILTTLLAYRLLLRARLAATGGNGDGTSQLRVSNSMSRLFMMGRLDPDVRARLRLAFMNRDFNANDYEMLNQLDAQNARGNGADEAEINRLPVHSVTQSYLDSVAAEAASTTSSSTRGNNGATARTTCSICLAPFEAGDVIRTVLCMHQFHKDCIDNWLRNKNECPVCKCQGTE